jgi:glycerol uptake facilitator-like aquaporin
MTRLVLPHDRKSNRTSGLLWCMGATILPSIWISFAFRPLVSEHIGLLLGAVIAGGFIYWTWSNLISGTYTSKQGNYRRDESPIRYWVHTIMIAAVTFLVLLFWIYQIRVVTGGSIEPNANKPRHATSTSRPVSMISRISTINPVIDARPRW